MPNFAPIVPATLPEDQRITAGHFYIDMRQITHRRPGV